MQTNQKNQTGSGRKSNQVSNGRSNTKSSGGNFANMDDMKHQEISGKGGKSSHSSGRSRSH
jgi:hypothetical protein